jgi:hypothetical protein
MSNFLIINCPHCFQPILIEELNCKIFRHGVLKSTNEQINPHSTEIECINYIFNDLIYGCGKPFKLNNELQPEICEYI